MSTEGAPSTPPSTPSTPSEAGSASRSARHAAARPQRTSVTGVLGEILMTLGLIVGLFVVWQLFWTDVVADREHAATVTQLEQTFAADPGSAPAPGKASAPVIEGDVWAIVRIPRFGADYARPLVEGTSAKELARGLGHYVDSAMPGEVGNFAVAGHRTTYGKPLSRIAELRNGDRIVVETAAGWTVYAVVSHEIVRPWQSEVIAPVPGDRSATPTKRLLTFTSCHPQFRATHRWVTHAELVETRTRAQGAPSLAVSMGAP